MLSCVFILAASPFIKAQYRDGASYEDLYDSRQVSQLKADVSYICSPAFPSLVRWIASSSLPFSFVWKYT